MTWSGTTGRGSHAARGLGLLLSALLLGAVAAPRAEAGQDHGARAAVIVQALRFVAWEPAAAPGGNLRVAVLGNTALGAALREACATMQPGGRRVTVVDVATTRDLLASRPEVVVLGALPDVTGEALIANLSRSGIVTMGDGDCPENRQIMLNLRPEGSRYRVQANPTTAAIAGVNLSARLLSLAQIVN